MTVATSDELPEPDEPSVEWGKRDTWVPYFQALGEFVHNFSALEGAIFLLLASRLNIPFKHGAAVLSGHRIDACVSAIKRLDTADGGDEGRDRLKRLWDQVAIITAVRNNILHHGAYDREKTGVLSIEKVRQTYTERPPERFEISVADLKLMISDLHRILSVVMFETACRHRDADQKLAEPWLYKQPQQARSPLPARTKKAGRRHAQKPSAE